MGDILEAVTSPRTVLDRYLPQDREAFLSAEATTGRVIVIAPTRAACETIELALGLHLDTVLQREHGAEIEKLASSGAGFGIVAGTGTGKTLEIRPIAETILGTKSLRVGVVNREREATPETPSWNVIIVTTGIARRWFQDNDITAADTLIVDEIHQTSAELELCLALGKRVGCRYIWLSATVDPSFYAQYLGSAAVIASSAFDPAKSATVKVINKEPLTFLDDKFLRDVYRERRGVGVFLPTRAGVEQVAETVRSLFPRINAAFYHGGEPIRVIRPFLEGAEKKPYVLAMTAAGQSALNVRGLDTVVIDDTRFTNIIERGKNVLSKLHLGSNEILQMAGRVHGRVDGGRVFILSDRMIDFKSLRPTAPEFQLAGDSERVALTCAALGVRAVDLELPVPLDRVSYRKALALLDDRGIVESGKLTTYGRAVEALPVDRPWAELLVNADDEMLPFVAVVSGIESLHRMTREERDLEGLTVPGSDHLTAYNVYAEALAKCGYVGEVYGLPRHQFDDSMMEWAERRGVLVKSMEDAALGLASVYRSLGMPLPSKLAFARDHTYKRFAELLARTMPFDLVIDEQTRDGGNARVSKTSVCGSWGAIAGTLRYFAGKSGEPRAGIEGTQIPASLIRKYATRSKPQLAYDAHRKHDQLFLMSRVEYFGFELDREVEAVREFSSPEIAAEARHVLALAAARGDARQVSLKKNQGAINAVREAYRRSGGATPRLGLEELSALYEKQLASINSVEEFRNARLVVNPDDFVPPHERERLARLPDVVLVRDREAWIDYDVEERADGSTFGIARLRLPEKIARTVTDSELPVLDRPMRFAVVRGQRGAVRADTLDELQELLDRPWSPDEIADETRRDDRKPQHDRRPLRGKHPHGGGKRNGPRGRGGRRR
ncbi:MAG: DEAD/DEAH box helicase [Gemmatimonadota bacterium]|nr:DEAD/DEAH box helicase [Gemmatimonadota bacterium]